VKVLGATAVVLGLGLAAACQNDDEVSYDVEASLFVESTCEATCGRGRDCASDWFEDYDSCLSDCGDRLLDQVEQPCFVYQGNVDQCRAQRLTCEAFDGPVTTSPGTPCGPLWSAWFTCLDEHPSD
jgi:hypothetical protein